MALLASCCCCSLTICCGVLGLYLLVAYIIALTIEVWWIVDAQEVLPVPAYLLTAEYLTLFLFSSVLLYGLNARKSTYLLVWMFLMGILLGPEAGMVLYMSIHHWRINTVQGLVEVTCWACRLLVNATAMLCVQSLYSTWREEKALMLRLQALKTSPAPGNNRGRLSSMKLAQSPQHEYLNHGYQSEEPKSGAEIITDFPCEENDFLDPFFIAPIDSPCEFNASTFNTSVIDARSKPHQDALINEENSLKSKTQSLIDIREAEEYNNSEVFTHSTNKLISLNYTNNLGKNEKLDDTITQSLDRRLLKNKNLKILRKLSPFLGRKTTDEVNVYQIHPPKIMEGIKALDEIPSTDSAPVENSSTAIFDHQLQRIYSHRGMYAYDERSRELIYYPPEFFSRGDQKMHRNRLPSNESNRSSVDSEDIRSKIGDVAL